MERGCGGGRKSEREGREKRRKVRVRERRGSREGESPTYCSFGSKVALECIIIYTAAMVSSTGWTEVLVRSGTCPDSAGFTVAM